MIWHFTDALTDFCFLIGSLAGCSSLLGPPALKQELVLCCCVFSFLGQFSVRKSSGSLPSVESMFPLRGVEEGELWTLLA